VAVTVSRHKRGRFWALRDAGGALICVCVYKKGAQEVRRRLTPLKTPRETLTPRRHPGWRTHERREDP
jgi:hypothetical protein